MTAFTVAIASSGRGSLAETLGSLWHLAREPGWSVELLVADDSPDGAAARILAAQPAPPFPARAIPVGACNISIARNACLDHARGDFVAFIDDDEIAPPDWLAALWRGIGEFDADCVFAPVRPVYPPDAPAAVVAADPLHVDWGPRGRRVMIGRSGNTLIRKSFLDRTGLRFDPEFGRSGGEDTDFFARLGAAGARMVVIDDGVLREAVGPERLTVSYLRRRAIRSGQTYARIMTRAMPPARRHGFYLLAGAKLVIAWLLGLLARPFAPASALRLSFRAWMNLGKLRHLIGRRTDALYAAGPADGRG